MFNIVKRAFFGAPEPDPMQTVQEETVPLAYHRYVCENWESAYDDLRSSYEEVDGRACAYKLALTNIAALETPNCAHIGKKMARIANAALAENE